MERPVHIAIDAMGGDHGLRVTLPAVLASLRQHSNLHFLLVGDPAALDSFVRSAGTHGARLRIVPATQVVEMDDKPTTALRQKRQSSMWLALAALAAGEADAVVSAGNTGALMAMGLATVPPPPPIERPAFCTRVPTRAGHCYLLDLGANVDCSAEQLLQFGLMGAALAAISDSSVAPRVGLLNIGAEANKGNEQVRAAARLLKATPDLNYVGPVEGDALFDGVADVVVCDGFVGNVALKVCEGTASMIRDRFRARLRAGLTGRLAAMLLAPVLAPLFRELDPQRYAGAMLLGLGGVVVKSHGNSSEQSFQRAISYAASAVENGLVAAIGERLKDAFTSAKN